MNTREKRLLGKLEWIAQLSAKTHPGGMPKDEAEWKGLVNRIVLEVRGVFSDLSDLSDKSDSSEKSEGFLPKHGGYRHLKSFQVSTLIYDATRIFCDRFVPIRSRTHDQMVQAARSGRQNIAEGSMASATSKKSELKLTNVAKASLEELLLDYEDYLRQAGLPLWKKDDARALEVRNRFRNYPQAWFAEVSDLSDKSPLLDPYGIEKSSAETAANTILCLTHQATYLLKRQLENLEKTFLEEGGFTERLYKARTDYRRKR